MHVLPQVVVPQHLVVEARCREALAACFGPASVAVRHPRQAEYPEDKDCEFLDGFFLHADGAATWLFCDNETNTRRLYGLDGGTGFFKDGFDEYIVHGRKDAVNPAGTGTKAGCASTR